MDWISATFSGLTADLLSHGSVAVIVYGLHWWRTRTLGGQLRSLKMEVDSLRQGALTPSPAKQEPVTMQNVSVVLTRPDGTVEGYMNCRIVPPKPEDGNSSAVVRLGHPISLGETQP